MIEKKEFRKSHADVFLSHYLDPVKGSSPDVNPLIYLLILVIKSSSKQYEI